ncbi:hypothetical protein GGI18_001352 [Coemansia linderi]|uniref:Uncharacterized protein n=1 Tax=Coemansia linderi TaxID=2663919 RepID=A0ACC1KKH6_9FUNG|nr:hypothetical protein GGI18_001352 [Coemansia linderi]
MSSNTHRPQVISEAKSKEVDVAHASKVLNRLLNQEAGVQSAPSSTLQQLQQLAKAVEHSGGAFGSGGGSGTSNNSSGFGGFGQPAQSKPTGFGSGTGAFGSTQAGGGGFGSGSGIGGFGGTSTGGGGFGSSASAFGGGASAPTGAFGSTGGGFGGGGGFGQPQQQQQPASGAGAASSLFGGGAFGSSAAGGFGAGATGTARAAFEPVVDVSTTGKKDSFRHICFMNAYKAFSPEELRLEDYEAGRKKADAPAAAPGARTGFGASAAGGFGSTAATGGFGQTAATGAFGSTSTGGFGQSAGGFGSTGGFGQQPASASVGGGFGLNKPATAAPAIGGFGSTGTGGFSGGFGQPAAAATGSIFGASKPSAFGATTAAPATGGFGSSASGFGSASTGGFGSASTGGFGGGGGFGQAASTGGFGQASTAAPAATGAFGSSGGAFGAKPAFGAATGFGSSAAAQPAAGLGFGQPSTGGFGQSTTGAFGQPAATGGFGQTAGATGAAGGGLFGQTTNAAGSTGGGLFGAKPAATGGLFGQSTAAPAAGGGGGLFGQQSTAAPATGGGLFGQTAPAATGGGLFGSTSGGASTGGGLFGAKPAAPATGGLFGSAPAAGTQAGAATGGGGLFGSGGGGLFGSNTATAAGATGTGGGLFGSAAAAPATGGTGLFGSTAGTGGGGGLFAAAPLSFGDMLGSPPQMGNPWADSPQKPSTLSNAGRTPAASRRTAASVAAELAAAGGEAEDEAESAFASPPVTRHLDDDTVAEQSDVEEEDEEEEDDGSGIKQGDYWMTPSLTALRTLKPQQLRAVKDFIVGRKGVGQVHFSRPVDLTTVGSLAAIAGGVVLFDDRVCTVYPDESNKPPRGQGLNVPATISLNNCWPVDRATGEPITRLDDPRVRKHTKRLRSIAETQFKDFSEGKWTFGVEHFSRYGLDDNQASSDGEDEEDVASDAKALDFVNATAQQAPVTAQQSLLDEGSRAVADVPLSSTVDDSLNVHKRFPRQLLLGARHAESLRRAPVMRASLFASSSDDSSSQQQQPPPEPAAASFGRIQTMSPAVPVALPQPKQPAANGARNQPRRRDNESQATVATEASIVALDLPPPSKFLRINETRIARELLSAPQPYAQSLTHGRSGLGADAGLMMARSFRVAFGFQGQLVYLQGSSRRMDDDDDDSASSKRGRGASSVVVVDSIARHLHAAPGCLEPLAVAGGDDDVERIRQRHLDTVSAQYRHAVIAPAEADSCPAVSFSADTTIASVLSDLSSATTDGSSQHQQLGEEERRILSLASVLFDEPTNAVDDDEDPIARQRVQAVRRRQALTKWMMSAVHDSVQRDLVRASESPSPAAAAVFALLSGHRIEAACLAATSHRDYRLAMLVAQCGAGAVGGGGNDAHMQALARVQLERIGEDPCLAPAYRRVYELIGGRVVNASAAIDWKRAFALGLWFAQSPADRIADAVSMYENAVAEPLTRLAPPLPAWLFQGSEECKRLSVLPVSDIGTANSKGNVGVVRAAARAADLHRRGVCDPVFQLLKLFSEPAYPLERALLSESFSAARGDSRLSALLAWLLAAIRQCRGFEDAKPSSSSGVVDSLAYDRLLAGWALQLESLGLWHWACFVLLQLSSSATHKAHAIRALLDRSMPTSLPTAALSPEGELLSLCGAGQSLDIVDDRIEEQLRFVLEDLRLPRQWLFEAMATRSRYDRDWLDVRSQGTFIDVEVEEHPVLVAARRQFTASGRPIVQSFFGQFASSQQRQQPVSARVDMPTDSRAAATLRHVVWLLSAQQLSAAHAVVLQSIAPDAILCGDYQLLSRVLGYLDPTTVAMPSSAKVVPFEEWATGGRVYQAFLAAVNDLPTVLQCIASAATMASLELMQELQRIYHDMRALLAALPTLAARFGEAPSSRGGAMGFAATAGDGEVCWYSAEEARVLCVKYSVTVSDMASVISGFVQKLESHAAGLATMEEAPVACAGADSAAALPLAQDVRILRTLQMARTCFDSLVGSELEA